MKFHLVAILLVSSLIPRAAQAVDPVYTGFLSSTAVGGYDPVAYFTQGAPVEGSSDHTFSWKGAQWRFASAENLATFRANPEHYAPQYGGYCAYAVSQGSTAPGDPLQWTIVNDRLYLNVNASIQARWAQDIPGYIAKADANWPALLAE